MNESTLAYIFLDQLSSNKRDLVSLRIHEFEVLRGLLPALSPIKNIKNSKGETTLLMIDRKRVIWELKNKYKFRTIKEAEAEVQDAYRGS